MKTYKGLQTKEISFPLGGIGSGSVGLCGNGRFRDWEIFNHPYKNSANGFTHILVRAQDEEGVIDARVLQGDYMENATGGETCNVTRGNGGFGYGFGPYRGTMAGVPHFENWEFEGEYPFAKINFQDSMFPGKVSLHAFNPFIPLNDKDSSLPAAFFKVEMENTQDKALEYTIFFSLNNPLPSGTTVNTGINEGSCTFINMGSNELAEDDLLYGTLSLGTDAEVTSIQEYWYRAKWFDSLETFWHEVQSGGKLPPRRYEENKGGKQPYKLNGDEMGTLAAHIQLAPKEKKTVRFILAWSFPNCANYWNPEPGMEKQRQWKNYYATLFTDAYDCAKYALKHWTRLQKETWLFKDALYKTTLPDYCLDAVSANLSILKSATCMRLEDGSFYGFEGCGPDYGCCEGSCSHVWNYAYALPYLYPSLERSMRELEYRYSQSEAGGVSFRLMLPLGRDREDFRPCVDGQMGGVMKAYRDFKLSGNLEWLREIWPSVKKSIEFAWSPENEDRWDFDRDGVMEGRQHHTLDMELFGPSSWLNGFYLGALKAGAEMAALLGEDETAAEYQALFEKGQRWCDANLFNGEYYQQDVDLKDKSLLEKYDGGKPLVGKNAVDAYWNEENGEMKYQVANGSSIDQVVAQWHANLIGLGDLYDKAQRKSALQAIYNHNFKKSSRNEFNPARIYCMDGEAGIRICSWPDQTPKPLVPITYAGEVMCGFEYSAAALMIQEGLTDEGMEIVKAIRDRFDGSRRNPWNEFECGSNYARSMASFSLIPAASGFTCDLYQNRIGFNPVLNGKAFNAFFSMESGWGNFELSAKGIQIQIHYGDLILQHLDLPGQASLISKVALGNEDLSFAVEEGTLTFERPVQIGAGNTLNLSF